MRYRVKELREERGMTQEELSRLSGISRATIWALETADDKATSTKTLAEIAQVLNVPIEALFSGSNA